MSIWQKESLKQKIYSQLLRQIIKGEIAPSMPLPSNAELTEKFNAGRETIKQVIARLAEEKYIIRRDRKTPLTAKKLPEKHYTVGIPYIEFPGHMLDDFNYEKAPWGWTLYRAVAEALLKRGHNAVLLNFDRGMDFCGNVHGIISFSSAVTRICAESTKLPIISVMVGGYDTPGTINLDRTQSMMKCATYFLAHGVRSILLMSFEKNYRNSNLSFVNKYLVDTLQDNGLAAENIVNFDYTRDTSAETGTDMMKKFMDMALPKPWGILCPGDFQAQAAVHTGIKAGLIPKKDFLVVGGTGLKEAANWTPALTTAGTAYEEIGEAAAQAMIEYIMTGEKPDAIHVKNKLIIRET